MRIVRPLVLALLAFALPAAGAQASSLTITPPSQPPNYWDGFTLNVSGVASQDARLYVIVAFDDRGTCSASLTDPHGLAQQRASVTGVAAGTFSAGVVFGPVKGYPHDNGSTPGPHTVCAYLEPASYDQRTQPEAPAALATGSGTVTLGPDCLGFTPVADPGVQRIPGKVGDFVISGDIRWNVTLNDFQNPPRQVGPGPWSETASISDEERSRLKKGLQVLEKNFAVSYSQTCTAPDGSSAPAPINLLTVPSYTPVRIGGDGALLGAHALPAPTYAEWLALGLIQTTEVDFPAGATTGGLFEREVRVKPVGGKRPVLVGTGHQTHMGLFEIKLTTPGRKVIAALGRKGKTATLLLETTFKAGDGRGGFLKPGPVKHSTMKIVKKR